MIAFLVEVLAVVLGVILAYWLEVIFHLTIPGGQNGQIGYVIICIFLVRAVLGLALSRYGGSWGKPQNP